jgi:flagellar assembly protein FliH
MMRVVRPIRHYRAGERVNLSEKNRQVRAHHGKPNEGEPGATGVTPGPSVEEAEQMGQAIIDNAHRQAEIILQKAAEDADALKAMAQAQGYDEGFQKGVSEGQLNAERELAPVIAQIQQILDAITEERARILASSEPAVVQLAMLIAEKIVGEIAQQHRSTVVQTVSKALNELAITGPFRIRVNPDDAVYLETLWNNDSTQMLAMVPPQQSTKWELVKDSNIDPGGCIVECGPATVDASLATQIRVIAEALETEV